MKKTAEMEMKKKKKKGRPSLLDLRKRNLEEHQQEQQQTLISSNPKFLSSNRRSKSDHDGIAPASDLISGDGGYDDDDERKEKKVKLVVRLPPSKHHCPQLRSSANSLSLSSASYGSDSNADGEKSKINAVGDRSGELSAVDQVELVEKAMETLHGSPLESGPTPPLPDKKLLVFILDRLQKKDIYGVFSEPVDPNELPDYHEIIENPMDFGTVRKKLDEGLYSNLEEFEADVFLICSNAMQYNAPDTIYFRQGRSIQELAKRDFENLKQVNDDGEPQPRIVRRGRPPSKNLKKPLGSPSFDRVGPESSSDATLATVGDNVIGSNSYNLRKVSMPLRFRSNDAFFRASHQFRNKETNPDSLSEWNNEFPASILKAEAKNGKKLFSSDENRRATYSEFYPSAFRHEPSVLTTLNIDMKQLMGVGLHSEHSYATSLARFAANLGPAVWNMASKKIEHVLPIGVKFGPGWVGENEASQRPLEQKSSNNSDHDGHPLGILIAPISGINLVATHGPSLAYKDDVAEAVRERNSDSELTQQKLGFHSPASVPNSHTAPEVALPGVQTRGVLLSRQFSIPVSPDLNVRFQAPGSPSPSFRMGSPRQPDLALQL